MDITVFSLDNTEGVDVGLLDLDDSLTAVALFEAVSLVLFSAFVEALDITSEFSSDLSGSLSEVSSHGGFSLLVLLVGNLEFISGSLEEFSIGLLKVVGIGVVFIGKGFLFCW